MTDEIQKIYSKIVGLETEVGDLRQGYLLINRRYSAALTSLKELTSHASEAAKRSASGALKAAEAAKHAAEAATEAVKMSNLASEAARSAHIKKEAGK
jgi:hypothetical protein